MAVKTTNLWDASTLDDDLLPPPPAAAPAPHVAAPTPRASLGSPPPRHLAAAPAPAAHAQAQAQGPVPRRHIMVALDAALVDSVRHHEWRQLTQAEVVAAVLDRHFGEVVEQARAPRPKVVGTAQWGVRLPLPVADQLAKVRAEAGGVAQVAALDAALRVALRRL